MKKTILALAAVLAFSGAAFAGASQPAKQTPAACAQSNASVKLDCTATGSVEKADASKTQTTKGPRLGIDVNPWFVPGL
ncbi:DUF680 domain-containing protein [Mesorhizobium sp. M1C.F.Ca.ET.193.01.1.1]|uniref:DUF680 domain-containing protein n=1 Tax=unclassified Mesorhizobium TaxID=325217 RepID=UPI000FD1DCFC|nr:MULTISPECIES: DUF680 domain-containing protein [unclassified Mesorhizobium]TGS94508.1 DUF680 domain-containing protein [bacterium M00.F.Ca.ET.177.01.1.1]TGQ51210.1 DUF680 domain-containing protein [Mesorhizobium sp. M1C.F.Ca.ET.210.01.1.1]TGQ66998.1 DUF680 domain-containing protein [Mesorhizobium sp. M1C.F.Ca.ET.212.01.1.1]TGR01121.1 DUF680 domain-containing protein [Mesorhizobium sp. M1C.F.Ca.ET.204.01.1.1]TGR21800.1 DUF680 domain-containing protein [Mesorhizobium sp. M1C.F.Ca.ET.196.01.1.